MRGARDTSLSNYDYAPFGALRGTCDISLTRGIDPAPAVTLASGGEETVTVSGGDFPGAAPDRPIRSSAGHG